MNKAQPLPSGLSAAYHLARLGHAVTIKEAGPLPGGMMRFGIPKYRLPRDVLDAEVGRIADLGVMIEYNAKVANIKDAMTNGGFDAAFPAVGAHIAKRAYIPAGEPGFRLFGLTRFEPAAASAGQNKSAGRGAGAALDGR